MKTTNNYIFIIYFFFCCSVPSKLNTTCLWTRRCVDKVYSKSRCCSNGGCHVLEEAGVLRVHTGHQRGFYPNIWPTLPCTGQKTRVRDTLLPQRHRHGDKTEFFLCRSPVFTLSSYHEARIKDALLMLLLLMRSVSAVFPHVGLDLIMPVCSV